MCLIELGTCSVHQILKAFFENNNDTKVHLSLLVKSALFNNVKLKVFR